MIDLCIKNGVNYFDTAWFYHDGKSEEILGGILKNYPRESYNFATFTSKELGIIDYLLEQKENDHLTPFRDSDDNPPTIPSCYRPGFRSAEQ